MLIDSNDYSRLAEGLPPEGDELLRRISVGVDFITDFWREQYIDAYISRGGSKIKFITGAPGSGKSHCLRLFLSDAARDGCKAVSISAKNTWLHDFREIYTAIFAAVDFRECLRICARKLMKEMGCEPGDPGEGQSFA